MVDFFSITGEKFEVQAGQHRRAQSAPVDPGELAWECEGVAIQNHSRERGYDVIVLFNVTAELHTGI